MTFKKIAGFSMVELMIAIALGALIIATVGGIYISARRTSNVQIGLARLQENGRYANYILNKEIRMAGFLGCSNQKHIELTNVVQNNQILANYDTPVLGYDGLTTSFSPSLPSNLTGKSIAGSDIIEVRMASSMGINIKQDMVQTNNPVLVEDRLGINAYDIVMITDCSVGDIFMAGANSNATAITHTVSNNTTNNLSVAYTTDAQVLRYLYYAIYVKDTGRTNAQGEAITGLYQQKIDGTEEEIAEGVEKMKILYGVDTDADLSADSYQTATQVEAGSNWDNVISVKISILMVTPENVNDKVQSYSFQGTAATPTDRKLRREWTTFINLRNRGLPE